MENHQKELRFVSQSILWSVLRGLLVGLVAGVIVVLFRLAIEEIFHWVQSIYQLAHQKPLYLFGIFLSYLGIAAILSRLIVGDEDIKGSGIPQVEAELKGLMHLKWWSVLWRKSIGGILSIASGLMLGREGPSIQLGAVAGKGVAKWLKTSEMEKRSLIASGAAAGLSAAFNAPVAGLLFIVEEVYHQFSRLVWVSALVASITANFISLNVFGLTPVLDMPDHLPILDLEHYWVYLVLGIFLGLMGFVYEKVILNISLFYKWIGDSLHLKPQYYSLIAFVAILPIGYWFPHLLGGGNQLILSLPDAVPTLGLLCLYFAIRFGFSMLSYGSGLPGGIFLPILTLGSLLGALAGRLAFDLQFISQDEMTIFIILGMAGFFSAISKAPLTAIVLVTEMVGDLRQLMLIAMVALMAYIVMDVLKGAPIYEAMLEKLLPEKTVTDDRITLIEVIVSDVIANKTVQELELPHHALITSQIRHGQSRLVRGNSRLHLGDTIYVAVRISDIQSVRSLLEGE